MALVHVGDGRGAGVAGTDAASVLPAVEVLANGTLNLERKTIIKNY